MRSPLQGPIADQITNALIDKLYDITYVQVTESFDPDTGETTVTRNEYTCKGFRDEFGKAVISNGLAKQTDAKFLILQQTLTDDSSNKIEPDGNDEIKHKGTTYSIINGDTDFGVTQDPASATWEVQARG